MRKHAYRLSAFAFCLLSGAIPVPAQNPLILDQFTADPSARVFEGKVYVYPSHDIPCGPGQGFIGFCMADYHVFSSENLTDWADHGVIVSQNKVDWVDSTRYGMWAPDCIYKDGKYYFYFPSPSRDRSLRKGMAIGVAVADKPYGPFKPESAPMDGVYGIDPNPFIDRDGQAYLYWAAAQQLFMAKLKDNMKELASEPRAVKDLPPKFKEGPYLFERNGIYYFTFPYVADKTEQLAYATGDNPMGPFKYAGVIMDESPVGCWTNHHSIIEYKGQWYLFYHHNDLSPRFDKNRSIRLDSLFFNGDGTIRKVIPTLRGVGVTPADRQIQIDRYSAVSEKGASIAFLDTLHRQEGWKTILEAKGSWTRYNSVDFGKGTWKSVEARTSSETGGIVEIRVDRMDGPLVARIKADKNAEWSVIKSGLKKAPSGIRHLFISLKDAEKVEIDWIRFK